MTEYEVLAEWDAPASWGRYRIVRSEHGIDLMWDSGSGFKLAYGPHIISLCEEILRLRSGDEAISAYADEIDRLRSQLDQRDRPFSWQCRACGRHHLSTSNERCPCLGSPEEP